jgi:ribonuclease T2
MRMIIALLALVLAAAPAAAAGRKAAPGEFDYYLLALTWSPGWCTAEPERRRKHADQCAKPEGFVVHGLWPQFRAGGWPQYCRPDSDVPKPVKDKAMAITPDRGLIEHEWDKHGSCTTLDAAGYFALAERARARVAIPEPLRAPAKRLRLERATLEKLFADANPGLTPEMIALSCGKAPEVRICFDKDLNFTACGKDVRDSCKTATFAPGW